MGGHAERAVLAFLRRHRWRYAGGIAALVAVDLLQLYIPRLLGELADRFAGGTLSGAGLAGITLRIVATAVLIGAGRWAWCQGLLGASRLLEADLRRQLFTHLQRLPVSYFATHRVGDLMAHLTNDLQAVRMAFGQGFVLAVDALFMTVAVGLAMLLTVDAPLTLLAAGPLALLSMALVPLGREVHRRFRRVQEGFSELSGWAEEQLAGIRVVKTFGREAAAARHFDVLARGQVARNLQLVRINALTDPVSSLLLGVAFAVLLLVGGQLVLDGAITLGAFVAFNSYLTMLVWPLTAVAWLINMVQRGRASLDRLSAILAQPPAPAAASGAEAEPEPVRPNGAGIAVRDLYFTYPGEGHAAVPALRGVSLSAEPGEFVGVVGPTGSGKSTLALLLLRMYEPPEGAIFFNGVDVRRLPVSWLREQIAYVPQEPFLFSESIASNIALGATREPLSPEQVEQAARQAALHEDVMQFSEGYAARVGERGVTLSGGQKQRVAIARALVKGAPVLLLDDALSSLDARTEQEILGHLQAPQAGEAGRGPAVTRILITHRLSAVRRADRIYVLDEGRVVECGTHADLLARHGLYARMYRRQQLEAELLAPRVTAAARAIGTG